MLKRLLITLGLLVVFACGQFSTEFQTKWINPRLFDGTVLEATYTPTPVKSLSQISIVLSGALTNTAAWTGTANKATLVFEGNLTSDNSGFENGNDFSYGTITSGAVVTATRGVNANTQTWKGLVVEYLPQFVKSAACGTLPILDAGISANATLVGVTATKVLVTYTGETHSYNTNSDLAIKGELLANLIWAASGGNTQLTVTRTYVASSAGTNLTVGYCYVEFR